MCLGRTLLLQLKAVVIEEKKRELDFEGKFVHSLDDLFLRTRKPLNSLVAIALLPKANRRKYNSTTSVMSLRNILYSGAPKRTVIF
jgi:hypothetical protein